MASRKEEKERRRQERIAAEQAAQSHTDRRKTYGIVVGVVLVLAVAGAIVAIIAAGGGSGGGGGADATPEADFPGGIKPAEPSQTDLFAAAKKGNCELKNPPIEGNTHVPASEKIDYKTNPPTSGNHDATPQPDGVYSGRPQDRHLVHALEGGRAEIQYNPDKLTQQQINQIGGLYNEDNLYMLIFPNRDMPYAVAITAWGHLAGCKKMTPATIDVLRAFRDRYRDAGPEPAAQHQASIGTPEWPGETPALEAESTPSSKSSSTTQR
jgi:hypothetical protein